MIRVLIQNLYTTFQLEGHLLIDGIFRLQIASELHTCKQQYL
jgi:hypothetical protein